MPQQHRLLRRRFHKVPNLLVQPRMAGQPWFGPHPHRTPSQRSRIVYAAEIAAAVFVIVASLVWLSVWLLARFV